MAVAISQTANPAGVSASSFVATYTSQSIGAAADDRIVVVVVGTELASSTPSACTIGGVAANAGTTGNFGAVYARVFWLPVATGTTADIAVTFSSTSPTNVQNHIAVYRVTGAAFGSTGGNGSTDMDATAPLTTGSTTIDTGGGIIGIAAGATDTVAKTWTNWTKDINADAGNFRFETGTSTTAGTATRTVQGSTNGEDGALSWIIFTSGAVVTETENVTVTESRTVFIDAPLSINKSESVTVTDNATGTATHYLDGSDAAANDPNNVWTDETNTDDGSTSTYGFTSTAGSPSNNFIIIEGSDAPASGGTISTVRARVFAGSNLDGGAWSSYVTLSAPTGGWTWDKVQALETKTYWQNDLGEDTIQAPIYTDGLAQLLGEPSFDTNNSATEFRVYRVEVEVTSQTFGGAVSIETGSGDRTVNKSESVTVTESRTVFIPELNINRSDSTTLTESVQRSTENRLNVSDSITLTENVQRDTTNRIQVSDSSTVTESLTAIADYAVNRSDTVTITENLQREVTGQIVATENTTVTDTPTVTIQSDVFDVDVNVSDTATLTENLQRSTDNRIAVTDSSTVSESVSIYEENYVINRSDTATLTENVQRQVENRVSVFDTTVPTDSPTVSVQPTTTPTVNVSDTSTLTENRTVLIPELLIDRTDTTTLTESTNVLIPFLNINRTDTSTVTENVAAYITELFIQETENISITENSIVSAGNQAFVNVITSDTTNVTENTQLELSAVLLSKSENITLTESTTIQRENAVDRNISVSDTATATENRIVEPPLAQIVETESVTATENTVVSVPTTTRSIQVADTISGNNTGRKYYIDSDGNVYWVISESVGLVEKV